MCLCMFFDLLPCNKKRVVFAFNEKCLMNFKKKIKINSPSSLLQSRKLKSTVTGLDPTGTISNKESNPLTYMPSLRTFLYL